ncbi:MAG TPA: glycoside hydrolase family 9 protein [Actinomycetota bacterium]|nr:glycoside hydrolase family 9 protein [Actinomycetota bacterium]
MTRHGGARTRRAAFAAAIALVATGAASPPAAGAPHPASHRSAPAGHRRTPTGFVRVNQAGYERGAPERAYLMSPVAALGAPFVVVNATGHVVLHGTAGPDLGAWSDRFPHVYALDFTGPATPGRYTIRVHGPVRAISPAFRVDTGARLAARPLRNALFFYRAERDGPDFVRSALRTAPAHLNDANAMTYLTPHTNGDGVFRGDLHPLGRRIDASGGWWDAGDYPKFVQTTSYTVDLLLAGVRDFPRSMGRGADGSNFTDEARFGLDWLLRMWDDPTRTLYYQVGIGEGNDHIAGDHDIWRLPQADDTYGGTDPTFRYIRHRPVFRAGPPGSRVSPNIAGRDAAAFALGYQVFRRSRPGLARRCLLAAEHVFDLADTNPSGHLLTVVPFDFYPETEWRDDLEFGATELAVALADRGTRPGLPHTHAMHYLRLAAHWANAYLHGPGDAGDVLNLYDVSGLAHAELVRAIRRAGDPAGLDVDPAQLLEDMRAELDAALAQGKKDPFGFGFRWAQWDTATHGAGMAVEAGEYDRLTHGDAYTDAGRRWLGNILGANAWGASFVVGDGSEFPHCMQHQPANIRGSLDGSPPVLRGAVVEGPNSFSAHGRLPGMRACPADGRDRFAEFDGHGAVFVDDVQSYDTVEPAIDLTAASPLAFAMEAAGQL